MIENNKTLQTSWKCVKAQHMYKIDLLRFINLIQVNVAATYVAESALLIHIVVLNGRLQISYLGVLGVKDQSKNPCYCLY